MRATGLIARDRWLYTISRLLRDFPHRQSVRAHHAARLWNERRANPAHSWLSAPPDCSWSARREEPKMGRHRFRRNAGECPRERLDYSGWARLFEVETEQPVTWKKMPRDNINRVRYWDSTSIGILDRYRPSTWPNRRTLVCSIVLLIIRSLVNPLLNWIGYERSSSWIGACLPSLRFREVRNNADRRMPIFLRMLSL